MSEEKYLEEMPISGKPYPLELFFERWGHLIIPHTRRMVPHPKRRGWSIPEVAVQEPDSQELAQ